MTLKQDPNESPDTSIHGSPSLGSDPLFGSRRGHIHSDKHRIAELERENTRLQKLVAELLLKNQQLRKPD